MQYWKYLQFFDKNGKNYNFDYDSDQDMWTGEIYLPEVSVGLFEVAQIFVLQKMVNRNSPYYPTGAIVGQAVTGNNVNATIPPAGGGSVSDGLYKWGFPHDLEESTDQTGGGGWNLEWKDTDPTEFKLFQFDTNFNTGTQTALELEDDGPPIEFYDEIYAALDYDPGQTFNVDGYLVTSNIRSEALQINVSINADEANTFRRTLRIIDQSTGTTVAEFTFYAETIEEDERLKVMTQNFGYNIVAKDSSIFRNTDINEALPDFTEINTKRKEAMLEGHNIYSYIGSYKGLINAIKFFGYDNLQVKEFWKNVNVNSPKFGTYIQSAPIGIFDPSVQLNDQQITLPNKNFRKTSLFSLIYKINDIVPGEFDIEDLPIVEEVNDFTIEEVLIKLFGLKKKLEKEFLPLNAHIKDIVGEADFFGLQELTNTISRNDTNTLKIGIDAKFCVEPNECVYLEDLRSFALDCFDSEAIVGKAFVDFCNAFITPLVNKAGANVILGPYNSGDQLPKPPIGPDQNGVFGPVIDGDNLRVSSIADIFLSYFTKYAPNINTTKYEDGRSSHQLPDKPGIPIGAPIVLKNCSFGNLTWETVNSTWNQLDNGGLYYYVDFRPLSPSVGDVFTIRDPETEIQVSYTVQGGDTEEDVRDALYTQIANLKSSFIDPWTFYKISKAEENCDTSGVCEFYDIRLFGDTPNRLVTEVTANNQFSTSQFQKIILPGAELYTWNSILRGNYTEIEWTIYKDETDVSPAYYYNVRGPIGTYERLPLTLPYVGDYSVEMKLFDVYNNISSKVEMDTICVDKREVEFSGWYQSRKYEYTWSSEGKYKWNDYGSHWSLPIEPSVTLGEETPKLYESLDRVNAILNNFGLGAGPDFQLLNFQDDGKASFSGPYQWKNLDVGNWNDTYHLWWDMTSTSGDTPAFFQFSELPTNSYLRIVDVKGNVGEFYFDPSYTTLGQAAAALNLSDDPIINKYVYNVVYDAALSQKFIQAVSRYFGVHGDWSDIEIVDADGNQVCAASGSTGSTGTGCQSIIYKKGMHTASNPTWNTAKFINEGKTLPRFTWVMFVYDNCRIFGKDKARWIIKNTTDPNIADIYFESKYLTYLFKHPGKYNITLELEDSNGNKYKKERNILIIK